MTSPSKKKGKGPPDCGFHDGNPQPQTNATSTLIPVSSSNSTASHSNESKPFEARPEQGESPRPAWKINTGNNRNKKGLQSSGNIRAANYTAKGPVPPSFFPQNGPFDLSTGNNDNEGDRQTSGNIDFGNVEFSNDGSGPR